MNIERPRKNKMQGKADICDGILLVDKPAGLTSHDVVAHIRRRFRLKKVGHGGTLDPMATGMLVILLGRGTKLSAQIMDSDKRYEGTLLLGVQTNTQDIEGTVEAEADASQITPEMVENKFSEYTGDIMQVPPMVSAKKLNGVPLYKLARKGKTVEREPRLIHIYGFKLLESDPPRFKFRLRCTKGTYVRTICHDIGNDLGCGGCLATLRRTRTGNLKVADATSLDDIMKMSPENLIAKVIPMHDA